MASCDVMRNMHNRVLSPLSLNMDRSKTPTCRAAGSTPQRNVDHSASLAGERVYLDLADSDLASSLVRIITTLGGSLEKFLSKDVTCIVSNKQVRVTPEVGGVMKRARKLRADSPVMSRGRALLLQSQKQGVDDVIQDPIEFAHKWSIMVINVSDFVRKYSTSSRCKENAPWQPANSMAAIKVTHFEGVYMKFEDVDSKHKPHYKCFPSFPDVTAADLPALELPKVNKDSTQLLPLSLSMHHSPRVSTTKQKHSPAIFTTNTPLPQKSLSSKSITSAVKKQCKIKMAEGKIGSKKHKDAVQKSGYCECCEEFFTNVKVHVSSDKHAQFASDHTNFSVLDETIGLLPAMSSFLQAETGSQHSCLVSCGLTGEDVIKACDKGLSLKEAELVGEDKKLEKEGVVSGRRNNEKSSKGMRRQVLTSDNSLECDYMAGSVTRVSRVLPVLPGQQTSSTNNTGVNQVPGGDMINSPAQTGGGDLKFCDDLRYNAEMPQGVDIRWDGESEDQASDPSMADRTLTHQPHTNDLPATDHHQPASSPNNSLPHPADIKTPTRDTCQKSLADTCNQSHLRRVMVGGQNSTPPAVHYITGSQVSSGSQVSLGIPGSQVSLGIPGSQVSLGIPGSQVSSGIPGSQVSSGIPGSVVSSGIPGSQVSSGIPGSQVSACLHASTPSTTATLISRSSSLDADLIGLPVFHVDQPISQTPAPPGVISGVMSETQMSWSSLQSQSEMRQVCTQVLDFLDAPKAIGFTDLPCLKTSSDQNSTPVMTPSQLNRSFHLEATPKGGNGSNLDVERFTRLDFSHMFDMDVVGLVDTEVCGLFDQESTNTSAPHLSSPCSISPPPCMPALQPVHYAPPHPASSLSPLLPSPGLAPRCLYPVTSETLHSLTPLQQLESECSPMDVSLVSPHPGSPYPMLSPSLPPSLNAPSPLPTHLIPHVPISPTNPPPGVFLSQPVLPASPLVSHAPIFHQIPHPLPYNPMSLRAVSSQSGSQLMSPRPMSQHVTSPRLMSPHVMSPRPMLTHLKSSWPMSSHIMSPGPLSSHIMSPGPLSSHIMSPGPMSSHIMSPGPLSSHIMSPGPMSSHTMSPGPMSSHTMSPFDHFMSRTPLSPLVTPTPATPKLMSPRPIANLLTHPDPSLPCVISPRAMYPTRIMSHQHNRAPAPGRSPASWTPGGSVPISAAGSRLSSSDRGPSAFSSVSASACIPDGKHPHQTHLAPCGAPYLVNTHHSSPQPCHHGDRSSQHQQPDKSPLRCPRQSHNNDVSGDVQRDQVIRASHSQPCGNLVCENRNPHHIVLHNATSRNPTQVDQIKVTPQGESKLSDSLTATSAVQAPRSPGELDAGEIDVVGKEEDSSLVECPDILTPPHTSSAIHTRPESMQPQRSKHFIDKVLRLLKLRISMNDMVCSLQPLHDLDSAKVTPRSCQSSTNKSLVSPKLRDCQRNDQVTPQASVWVITNSNPDSLKMSLKKCPLGPTKVPSTDSPANWGVRRSGNCKLIPSAKKSSRGSCLIDKQSDSPGSVKKVYKRRKLLL